MSNFRDGRVTRSPALPLRREQVAGSSVERLAEQVQAIQVATADATEPARRDRRTQARTYEAVACGSGGALVRISHGLGREVRWAVVDWRRTTPGGWHGLERASQTDENTLVLASYVAGTATIEVW